MNFFPTRLPLPQPIPDEPKALIFIPELLTRLVRKTPYFKTGRSSGSSSLSHKLPLPQRFQPLQRKLQPLIVMLLCQFRPADFLV